MYILTAGQIDIDTELKCRNNAQILKLQAMPMVKRANTHGRPCEILEAFWKDDPIGR